MTETTTKHCNQCGNDYPATTEFFFPSYLKEDGRDTCKTCHSARKSKSVTFHAQLRELAFPIEAEKVHLYQSLNSIAHAIGWSVAKVEHDIYEKKLPIYTFLYNNVGPALALQMEDAKAYIAEHELNEHTSVSVSAPVHELIHELNEHTSAPVKECKVIGTPDTCGCCEANKGNILAVLDTKKEIRAYLCSTCYRTAASYKWDPQRMKNMAHLIETIGIENLSV